MSNTTPGGVKLEARSLTKKYGEREVLRKAQLTVEPGQFIAIVGRSGCGKSTLLRLVAGLESVTRGSIKLGSQSVSGLSEATRIMFQESRLLP
ncbi:MAG: ATP-binding cassette domain-containing protein, partial [Burkholderiales bacterium]|nr:ATP-binding cassette domain-containing protein [Burkholderiales bacterium]